MCFPLPPEVLRLSRRRTLFRGVPDRVFGLKPTVPSQCDFGGVRSAHEGAKVTGLYQMTDGLDSVQLELRFQLEGVECPAVGAKSEPSVCFVHSEHATLEVVWRQTE